MVVSNYCHMLGREEPPVVREDGALNFEEGEEVCMDVRGFDSVCD
jgi:hypothetical protein